MSIPLPSPCKYCEAPPPAGHSGHCPQREIDQITEQLVERTRELTICRIERREAWEKLDELRAELVKTKISLANAYTEMESALADQERDLMWEQKEYLERLE